ncbi:OmpA family protein [Vibrio sp. SM6]|uniref:OmpA family protein n=1 Tax=Vibrio agarilyticus TaxID=2726741 RepID=A0A7X8TTK4_9VIBR|nr:OmpA family protein [Vibrio agarilyticus]NLS14571.1 OmpA family protein [Vibrio agarilyticus]
MLKRFGALSATFILVGCQSTNFGYSMLDVAPEDSQLLRHPNWGEPQLQVIEERTETRIVIGQPRPTHALSQLQSLEHGLARRGWHYQILSGQYLMIHLTEGIHFKTNSSEISEPSRRWLLSLAEYLSTQPEVEIVINGHTDDSGRNRYNDGLSERRAQMVKQILMQGKMPITRLFTRAFGEYLPSCSNQTNSGRTCNRRVDLVLLVPQR